MSDPDRRAALLRVAAGLAGPVVPERHDWDQWMWLARVDRVAPLLFQLVDRTPTDLGDDERTDLRQVHGAVMCRCVQLEHHLIAVTNLLAAHGIPSVVLKGGATAHLDYPTPSWREFSDIDLLIEPAERTRATAVVEGEGWKQGYALPRGHESFTHAVTFVREGMELDLHQRIAHRALGLLVPTKELMSRAVPFEVAGAELLALDDIDRVIHASIHAVASRGATKRLSSTADVLLLAERYVAQAPQVVDRAEGWRIGLILHRAVIEAYATARLDVPDAWVSALGKRRRRRDRLVDRAFASDVRHPLLEELAYLRLLGHWSDRRRYLYGYLAPEHDYAEQHGRSGSLAQAAYLFSKVRHPN